MGLSQGLASRAGAPTEHKRLGGELLCLHAYPILGRPIDSIHRSDIQPQVKTVSAALSRELPQARRWLR